MWFPSLSGHISSLCAPMPLPLSLPLPLPLPRPRPRPRPRPSQSPFENFVRVEDLLRVDGKSDWLNIHWGGRRGYNADWCRGFDAECWTLLLMVMVIGICVKMDWLGEVGPVGGFFFWKNAVVDIAILLLLLCYFVDSVLREREREREVIYFFYRYNLFYSALQ